MCTPISIVLHIPWILIIIGTNECASQSAVWQQIKEPSNGVCDVIETAHVTMETECGRHCMKLPNCTGFTYDIAMEPNCYMMSTEPSSGCGESTDAEYYTMVARTFQCPADDGKYRTFIIDDSTFFTIRIVQLDIDYDTATADCFNTGGILAKVSTVARLSLIQRLMTTCPGFGQHRYYLGGSNINAADYNAPNAWTWTDGEPVQMSSTFWQPSRPNFPHLEHCLVIEGESSGQWRFNDDGCNEKRSYICEKR